MCLAAHNLVEVKVLLELPKLFKVPPHKKKEEALECQKKLLSSIPNNSLSLSAVLGMFKFTSRSLIF